MADDILTLREFIVMCIEWGDLDAPVHVWANAVDGPYERHWVDGFSTQAGHQEINVVGERQAIRQGRRGDHAIRQHAGVDSAPAAVVDPRDGRGFVRSRGSHDGGHLSDVRLG